MCFITFAYNIREDFPFILASNRDEFFSRKTDNIHFWDDGKTIAGKDLVGGGTWLGITTTGRFAALTNFRDPNRKIKNKISRGMLTKNFLSSAQSATDYINELPQNDDRYEGYNLLLGDPSGLYYYSNYIDKPQKLKTGIYTLSNGLLNTDWEKIKKGNTFLQESITSQSTLSHKQLFAFLSDDTQAPDHLLPDTGVTYEWEKAVSSIFVKTNKNYGTRSSMTMLIDRENQLDIKERNHLNLEKDIHINTEINTKNLFGIPNN